MAQRLTFRERQIVALVKQAKFNREIAADLHLTEGTIKQYMHEIFGKLGVKTRTQLAMLQIAAESDSEVKC